MKNLALSFCTVSAAVLAAPAAFDEPLTKRLDNGLGKTPALGYNNWVTLFLFLNPTVKLTDIRL